MHLNLIGSLIVDQPLRIFVILLHTEIGYRRKLHDDRLDDACSVEILTSVVIASSDEKFRNLAAVMYLS